MLELFILRGIVILLLLYLVVRWIYRYWTAQSNCRSCSKKAGCEKYLTAQRTINACKDYEKQEEDRHEGQP